PVPLSFCVPQSEHREASSAPRIQEKTAQSSDALGSSATSEKSCSLSIPPLLAFFFLLLQLNTGQEAMEG
ncbi:hypothetical protein LEMLEM_LOCUS11018, partial [Lemmus lemmus]